MNGHRVFRALSAASFGLTYLTMLLGGNVIASGAGDACPDWPTCAGALLAPFSGLAGIEWSHRVSALLLALTVLALAVVGVAYEARRPVLRLLGLVCFVLVVLLAALGGLIIESQLSVGVVLIHFGLATVLLGLTFFLVVVANLPSVPRRWIAWMVRASEERPETAPAAPEPAGAPGGVPRSVPGARARSFDR